jgi:hypothetical protein
MSSGGLRRRSNYKADFHVSRANASHLFGASAFDGLVISFLKYMARQEEMLEWKTFFISALFGSTLARGTCYDMSAASWMDRFAYMEGALSA